MNTIQSLLNEIAYNRASFRIIDDDRPAAFQALERLSFLPKTVVKRGGTRREAGPLSRDTSPDRTAPTAPSSSSGFI